MKEEGGNVQQGGKVRRKSIDTEGGKGLIRHSRATRRKRMEPAKQSKKIKEESGKVLLCANVECTKFLCEVNEHTIPAHARLLLQKTIFKLTVPLCSMSYENYLIVSRDDDCASRTASSPRLNATNVLFACALSVLWPPCPRSFLKALNVK